MSENAIFLNEDRTIPYYEEENDEEENGHFSFRLYVPTRVLQTLGVGRVQKTQGGTALSAISTVRKCIIKRGYINSPSPEETGILFDGGITILDSTGKKGTTNGKIWTFQSGDIEGSPSEAIKKLILGSANDFSNRIEMIVRGYMLQDEADRKSVDERIQSARGDAMEARFGTFGRRG